MTTVEHYVTRLKDSALRFHVYESPVKFLWYSSNYERFFNHVLVAPTIYQLLTFANNSSCTTCNDFFRDCNEKENNSTFISFNVSYHSLLYHWSAPFYWIALAEVARCECVNRLSAEKPLIRPLAPLATHLFRVAWDESARESLEERTPWRPRKIW